MVKLNEEELPGKSNIWRTKRKLLHDREDARVEIFNRHTALDEPIEGCSDARWHRRFGHQNRRIDRDIVVLQLLE